MTLLEIIKFFKENSFLILMIGLVGATIGILFYFFYPVKYVAVGSLFVSRSANYTSPDYFDYEGYYAQETAKSYTSTVIGLIESPDIRVSVASDILLEPTKSNLAKLKRNLRVKRKGSQVIELSVYGDLSSVAETWHAYVSNVIEKSISLNEKGDSSLYLVPVANEPSVEQTFRNLAVNIVLGFGFGSLFATFVLASKRYFKSA